jgi:DNA gyrase subunit B
MSSVEIGVGNGGQRMLEGGDLRKFLNALDELTLLTPKLERRLRDERVVELLLDTSLALDKRDDLNGSAETLPPALQTLRERLDALGLRTETSFEEEHSVHRLTYFDATNAPRHIDLDLLQTAEYRRFRVLARDVAEYNHAPFRILRGDIGDEVPHWRILLESVRKEGMKDSSVQRYKGLGEMNAEQLWDTTMNAEQRTLLQVRLEDLIECEEIFSTLMGENVESRRKFIEENALDVKNLDI